ncbi:MAG: hypothetical protein WB441_10290 [Nocardioidaceae bacterium]
MTRATQHRLVDELGAGGLRADDLRASPQAMREGVRRAVGLGHDTWTGPFSELVTALAELARVDLCLARLVEGHADGLRILDQADGTPRDGVYGVWASRSAGTGVRAVRQDGRWRLVGECRFASGIDLVDRALLPGWLDDGTHLLFDIALDGVHPDRSSWRTPAMDGSRSFTVRVDLAVGDEDVVGGPGFYLDRPGFVLGGLAVAAVWAGGVASVLDLVATGLRRFRPSAHQLRRLGVMQQAAWAARGAVDGTARSLPLLAAEHRAAEVTAARTAAVTAAEQVVEEAGRVVGPGGLTGDERLARTLADLSIYIRQHHLDGTLEALGAAALRDRQVLG